MKREDLEIHATEVNVLALRHAVYRELHTLLPPASIDQTLQFIANLALCRKIYNTAETVDERNKAISVIVNRFRDLRVSPDIALATNLRKLSHSEIEHSIERKFGDSLAEIPGFYLSDRWRLNLPEGCVLYPYRSGLGFINGFLCQPLSYRDRYFLLSSAKYDGFKAIGLRPEDQLFFQAYKESPSVMQRVECTADLSGFRWTGRRFIETNH